MNLRPTLAFVLICCASGMADDTTLKDRAKAKVDEYYDAVMKHSHGKVVDLMHPKVVELAGGRGKMIAESEAYDARRQEQGLVFVSWKVEELSDSIRQGPNVYIVATSLLELKAPASRTRARAYKICVSADEGKSWFQVNWDGDHEKLKQILPDLPSRLKLPARQKPVVEKD